MAAIKIDTAIAAEVNMIVRLSDAKLSLALGISRHDMCACAFLAILKSTNLHPDLRMRLQTFVEDQQQRLEGSHALSYDAEDDEDGNVILAPTPVDPFMTSTEPTALGDLAI